MLARWTTTSCRAFALVALALTPAVARGAESDKVVPPKFPIAQLWTKDLDAAVAVPPVSDGTRAYVALRSGKLVAFNLADGQEAWRIDKAIASPIAAAGGLVFVAAGDAIEALRGTDHASVWTVPRVTTTAPLVAVDDWLIAVTDTEILAIASKDGRVIWRKPAGGVKIAPAVDEDMVYVGANDGTVLALKLATGDKAWDAFVQDGVTALAAYHQVVYVGAGDKNFYSFKDGKSERPVRRVGSVVIGIAVDDEHVYVAAKDNVIYGLDRGNGAIRWSEPLRSRPFNGVIARGHIVFVPLTASHDLPMFFAGNGKPSGTLGLPGDVVLDLPPDIDTTAAGVRLVVVTGGLANQWRLTAFATAGEPAPVPVADFLPEAGVDLLTDPALQPIGSVLGSLLMSDPPLVPVELAGFPIALQDPPLEPLTTYPGLQLRPLSPQLPSRRGGS